MNQLIDGKNPQTNIVCIEVKDDKAELFIETHTGIEIKTVKNQNWIFGNEKLNSNWIRLDGDLHYKYAGLYKTEREFFTARSKFKHSDIYSIYNSKERLMVKDGFCYFKGMKQSDVSVLSFDIETTGLEHDSTAKLLLISNTFRRNGVIERKLFAYTDFWSEAEMLEAWCKWVKEKDPSIIVNHNINSFDLPYINFIAGRADVELNLGRDGSAIKFDNYESKFRKDATQFYHYNKCKIYGREIIDTLFLSLKYDVGRKYENYKLKNIIKQEGLEVKDRVFYDAGTIRDNYKNPVEWEKIKAYAIFDADDALALFDLMSPPFFYSAQIIPKPFQLICESAEGSKINSMMVRAYVQEKHSLPKESPAIEFEGAISRGSPGIFKNVFKVDVASLYPSIMINYKVYDVEKDPKGYFLELVETLTEQRLHNKKLGKETNDRYYKDLEQSQKILINSCYGFLAATGLLFNSPTKAAFITQMGREILQKSLDWCDSKGFKISNCDTDSVSFSKADEAFISKEERKLLLVELNSIYPERIRFEDDGFYKKFIVFMAKNYVTYSEDGTLKTKGSALRASLKEPALKEFINKVIGVLLE